MSTLVTTAGISLAKPDEPNAFKFGKIVGEPVDAYHACSALSKTKLDVFRDSPLLFKKRFITRELSSEKTDALIVGGAVDTLALEGQKEFNSRYAIEPDDSPRRPTKAQIAALKKSPAALESIDYWTRYDAENKGKDVLTDKQFALVKRCADALHANETFARFMQFGESQVTFRIPGHRFALQCRPDRWLEEGCDLTDGMPCIVDVKTIAELPADNPDHLARHIGNFGYHRGAYLYPEIVSTVLKYKSGYRPPFILALVEKREPHAVLIRVVDQVAIDVGEREVSESLDRLKKCLADNFWPESWEAPMSPVSLTSYYVRKSAESVPTNLWG